MIKIPRPYNRVFCRKCCLILELSRDSFTSSSLRYIFSIGLFSTDTLNCALKYVSNSVNCFLQLTTKD